MTWKTFLAEELATRGETMADVIRVVPDRALNRRFDKYGTPRYGFTAWTKTRVYFPTVYDSFPAVQSVPRYPCHEVVFQVNGTQDDDPPPKFETEAAHKARMRKSAAARKREEREAERHSRAVREANAKARREFLSKFLDEAELGDAVVCKGPEHEMMSA